MAVTVRINGLRKVGPRIGDRRYRMGSTITKGQSADRKTSPAQGMRFHPRCTYASIINGHSASPATPFAPSRALGVRVTRADRPFLFFAPLARCCLIYM